jgi:hypothetical protein
MKTKITFLAPGLLILAALVVTTQSSTATVKDNGPSAFGQGAFSFFNGLHTEQWGYSFEAFGNKNGQARGRATFEILENSIQTHVEVKINCLEVDTSPQIASALITGTVLHSDDPEFPKHATVIFAAEDNIPPALHPDIITRMFVFEGGDCHSGAFPLTFFEQPPDAIHIEP